MPGGCTPPPPSSPTPPAHCMQIHPHLHQIKCNNIDLWIPLVEISFDSIILNKSLQFWQIRQNEVKVQNRSIGGSIKRTFSLNFYKF